MDILDWFRNFDQKLLIIPYAIFNFLNWIGVVLSNLANNVGMAVANFFSLVGNNIDSKSGSLGNYVKNITENINKTTQWVKELSGKTIIYFLKLFAYDPTMWLIEFGVALIMLSVEIVVDIVTTLFDYVTNRVPATIIDALFSISGINVIPGVGALKDAMQSVINNLFKVPPEIVVPDIAGAIGAAVSGIAKRAADAAWDAAKDFFKF
jgi:hypothetical protein